MNRWTPVFLCLTLTLFARPAQADPVTYTGRVVGTDGKPVSGVTVGNYWYGDAKKGMTCHQGVKTDADGRFKVSAESLNRPISLLAVTADNKLGGRIMADPKKQTEGFEIKLGPLVRVHGGFKCVLPDHPVRVSNVIAFGFKDNTTTRDINNYLLVAQSLCVDREAFRTGKPPKPPTFDLWLPPGEYVFNFFEPMQPEKHAGKAASVSIKADQPGLDLDLGAIELKPSKLEQGYGKPAPPLAIKDARGLPKDVKLDDFKGKWVILEFWSWGCGPCISMGLPNMVDFFEEHAVDRDKFVILAVHNDSASDFAELDKKIASTIKNLWRGKPLPFPILLDDGKTFEAYGISAIPAMALINPEGKLVHPDLKELESKLTPIPIDRRIARALDRQAEFGTNKDGADLKFLVETLAGMAQIEIKPDPSLDLKTVVPLTIAGRLSLKSWLDLTLEPLNLVAEPGPEGLIVKKAGPDHRPDPTVSATQREAAERIAAKLQAKTTFAFENATLAEVAAFFEKQTEESFIVDPSDRLAKRLDLETKVSGKAAEIPMTEALKALLTPIGVEAVIRDEVVILRRFRP